MTLFGRNGCEGGCEVKCTFEQIFCYRKKAESRLFGKFLNHCALPLVYVCGSPLFLVDIVQDLVSSLVSIWSSESSGSSQSSQKMFRRSGRSYGNATRTIANDPDRFKIYTIVPIVRIELNSILAIEVVSVVRVVCDRLGSVSIWSTRSSEHFFETTGTIRTIVWKPGFILPISCLDGLINRHVGITHSICNNTLNTILLNEASKNTVFGH